MLFAILPTAMDGAETVLNMLDALVERAACDVHEIEIRQADDMESSRWYASSRSDRRKLLKEIARTSHYRAPRTQGPHLRRIEVSDEATAAQARNSAYAPLLVLAENDGSDRALVEAALRLFAVPKVLELCFGAPSRLEPPAFEIESRGGHGELKKLINTRRAEAAARGREARLVVVTDSDGEWPGEVKDHAKTIRSLCAEHAIPCPPLNKRTVENYIPDDVWRAWVADPNRTNARPAVDVLLRLSPEQRDHVHLAATNTDPWDTKNLKAAAVFQSVSTVDYELLKQADLKGKKTAMTILALNTHRAALSSTDFKVRDHQGDLLSLVRHIENEL